MTLCVSPIVLWFKHGTAPFSSFSPKEQYWWNHVHSHSSLSQTLFGHSDTSPGDTPHPLRVVAAISFSISQQSLITESFPSITLPNIEPKTGAQIHSLCLSQPGSPGDRQDPWQMAWLWINWIKGRFASHLINLWGLEDKYAWKSCLQAKGKSPLILFQRLCQFTAAKRIG